MSDDEPEFDLTRMIDVLERHGVRYVLIGGVSGTFHGMVEYQTKDVDVLVQNSMGESRSVGGGADGTRCSTGQNH